MNNNINYKYGELKVPITPSINRELKFPITPSINGELEFPITPSINRDPRFGSIISSRLITPPIIITPPITVKSSIINFESRSVKGLPITTLKKVIVQNGNPQLICQYNKKLYYESIIKKNKEIMNAPLPPKYSPLYFQTGYNLIYNPAKEYIP